MTFYGHNTDFKSAIKNVPHVYVVIGCICKLVDVNITFKSQTIGCKITVLPLYII